MPQHGSESIRSSVFHRLITTVYDRTLRPHLPKKLGLYNNVAVKDRGLFDIQDILPGYEEALVTAIRERVEGGDEVVVIGGGKGVSSVVAARNTGDDGQVNVYEAGSDEVDRVNETVTINRVRESTNVVHALVGEPNHVYSESADADVVSPEEIPNCDVLVMDCEGAELGILRNLVVFPRVIIVETHAIYNSPEDTVRSELEELGYTIVFRGIEEPEDGVFVLTAIRRR